LGHTGIQRLAQKSQLAMGKLPPGTIGLPRLRRIVLDSSLLLYQPSFREEAQKIFFNPSMIFVCNRRSGHQNNRHRKRELSLVHPENLP
jgi:hypothetical protein